MWLHTLYFTWLTICIDLITKVKSLRRKLILFKHTLCFTFIKKILYFAIFYKFENSFGKCEMRSTNLNPVVLSPNDGSQRDRETETQRERETETHRQRETDRQTERDRETLSYFQISLYLCFLAKEKFLKICHWIYGHKLYSVCICLWYHQKM